MAGFFITGTDTCVGKTRFASLLAKLLISKKVDVKVCKPIATGGLRNSKGVLVSEDTLALSRASGDKDLKAITPWCFEIPASPALAEWPRATSSRRRQRPAHCISANFGASSVASI